MKTYISMAMCLFVIITLLFVMCSCATIPQDKPETPDQCFAGKFNPFKLPTWEYTRMSAYIFLMKNPEVGKLPDYVLVKLTPYGTIGRYAYLDGRKVVAYKYDMETKCYVVDELKPEIADYMKKHFLKLRNGAEV